MDAVPAGKPNSKPTPYRLTAVLEKAGPSWRVVQLQFSFYESPYDNAP